MKMPRGKPKSDLQDETDTNESPAIFEPEPSLPVDPNSEIARLESQLGQLRQTEKISQRRAIQLEMELHALRADRDMYKRRLMEAQAKLEQMTGTPFPVGVVECVLPKPQNRAIVRLISGQTFVCAMPPELVLKEGDNVALHQRSMSIIEILPPLVDPSVMAMELLEKPAETYADIGGLDEQLVEIREVIELSLNDPDAFKTFNITPPRGILLHGAPGTGKTLIAKAVAHASHANFLRIAAPELVQKFIGEGARLVREVFKVARENSPAIIFIDEIDAIAAKRMNEVQSGEREVNRTLMQLLAEMDGFGINSQVRIIAATNRIDILDPAILRPGRFDRLIELPLPNADGRRSILKIHIRDLPVAKIDMDVIVNKTEGFSGAELKAVTTEAAMFALRDRLVGTNRTKITQTDFENAIQKLKGKKEQDDARRALDEKRLYA
jgi:proteasome regulatory subunit